MCFQVSTNSNNFVFTYSAVVWLVWYWYSTILVYTNYAVVQQFHIGIYQHLQSKMNVLAVFWFGFELLMVCVCIVPQFYCISSFHVDRTPILWCLLREFLSTYFKKRSWESFLNQSTDCRFRTQLMLQLLSDMMAIFALLLNQTSIT